MVNIDGKDAPGTMRQVYDAMGKCCLRYEEEPRLKGHNTNN